jgi:uncharacterized protein
LQLPQMTDGPQVTPIMHLFDGKFLYFITDYGEKKEKNLRQNNKIAAVVDVYARTTQKGVAIQGIAQFIEKGVVFNKIEKMFEERHRYYKANPVKAGESPIVKIVPKSKTSWGL